MKLTVKFTRMRIASMMFSLVTMITIPGIFPVPAAASHLVAQKKGADKPISLAGTRVVIAFDGEAGNKAKEVLIRKLGVTSNSLAEGVPCNINSNNICFWFEKDPVCVPVNANSSSSYYDGGGGVTISNSGSGEECYVTLHMDLVELTGPNEYHETSLAVVTAGGFAGQNYNSGSSYNWDGSGYYSASFQTPKEFAIGSAMHNAVMVLLDGHWWRNFSNPNTSAEWFPDTAEAVRRAFAR